MINYDENFKNLNKCIRRMSELWFWIDEMEKKGIKRATIVKLLNHEFEEANKRVERTNKNR